MFSKKDFEVFNIPGLDPRMAAIRAQIQPEFQKLGSYFTAALEPLLGEALPIHIAKHIRRSVHPPEATWMAIGGDSRGYKKYPHFQLAIHPNYCAMWLAFIDNPVNEKKMAQYYLNHLSDFENLSDEFVISTDHTSEHYSPIRETDLTAALTRWRDVKKGEFMVGRIIPSSSPLLKNSIKAQAFMLKTYQQVIPFYQQAMVQHKKLEFRKN